MREKEIPLPADFDSRRVESSIELALAQAGLAITLRGSLKKFPGCLHWHAKSGKRAGTLEVTYWPHEARAWFTIQDGRAAEWIDEALVQVGDAIRDNLA